MPRLWLFTQYGADVAAQDGQGANGLDFMRDARAEAVKLLIQQGADVNARDANNSTPLHLASSWGKVESMRLLIEHTART